MEEFILYPILRGRFDRLFASITYLHGHASLFRVSLSSFIGYHSIRSSAITQIKNNGIEALQVTDESDSHE